MQILVNQSPFFSAYCCDKGEIRLVLRNVSISMQPVEFHAFNYQVQDALTRLESSHSVHPYVSLRYMSTNICLSIDDLTKLGPAMQKAVESMDNTLQRAPHAKSSGRRRAIQGSPLHPPYDSAKHLDTISNNLILSN